MADPDEQQHAQVSSDAEQLILVDAADEPVGYLSKGACHDGEGVRHRALSLFVFAPSGEVLLQRRARHKRLWPGYWSNACCSHPRRGERVADAVRRRAAEELGIGLTALEYIYKFEYQARFGEAGSEHELCWVFVAASADPPRPHPDEVAAIDWAAPAAIDRAIAERPGLFTPWFRIEWQRLRTAFSDRLPAPA